VALVKSGQPAGENWPNSGVDDGIHLLFIRYK
jgi:hypothetical protein